MPKIIYVSKQGERTEVLVDNGYTVMEGAVNNDIDGMPAECGGACACATCHVYIDKKWENKLPKKEDSEIDMLDMAFEPNEFSRLGCQIIISEDLDGLVVKMPSKQG